MQDNRIAYCNLRGEVRWRFQHRASIYDSDIDMNASNLRNSAVVLACKP